LTDKEVLAAQVDPTGTLFACAGGDKLVKVVFIHYASLILK
jgi:hypothetical protein